MDKNEWHERYKKRLQERAHLTDKQTQNCMIWNLGLRICTGNFKNKYED